MFTWSPTSKAKILKLHPDLIKVLDHLIQVTPMDITVLEGVRTLARQRELLRHGATTTLRSRHLTGHAVDLAPLVNDEIRWDWPLFNRLGPIVKAAAEDMDVLLEWGGDWKKFKDGPHFQLPWSTHP